MRQKDRGICTVQARAALVSGQSAVAACSLAAGVCAVPRLVSAGREQTAAVMAVDVRHGALGRGVLGSPLSKPASRMFPLAFDGAACSPVSQRHRCTAVLARVADVRLHLPGVPSRRLGPAIGRAGVLAGSLSGGGLGFERLGCERLHGWHVGSGDGGGQTSCASPAHSTTACAYCGNRPERLEPDHVVPLSRGGMNSLSNLLPACPACNSDKRAILLPDWNADRTRRGKPPRTTEWGTDDARYWHLAISGSGAGRHAA
jgi:hypothetical protein